MKATVTVCYTGAIRTYTGKRSESFDLQEAGNLRALMALLVARYGKGFESRVFVEGGGLNNLARVLVGEVEVPELPVGMDTALEPGSVVTIITITALAGGENLDPGVHEGPGQRHGIRVDQS